ncbi:MAG: proline dehydrogenase family protein [Gemmatimonadetes bacterium]|nr:proline dehydrogenase family protein [Gemmatimonadota bacterium]
MLRSSLLWLSERNGVFDFVKGNSVARKMASRFVAGETPDTAIEAVTEINSTNLTASLDLLGESVTNEQEAVSARVEIVDVLERIKETGVDANVSIKLTQMGLDLDLDSCAGNMRALLEVARKHDIFVRIDMESSQYTERTLTLFREQLYPEFGDLVGVVIQTCLYRAAQDVEDLINQGARVRLVKGAYAELASVAFPDKRDVDATYATLTERLLSEGNYPAIATHDESLIDHARTYARERDIDPERFEFQMLYGVRRDLQQSLRQAGYNVRVYVPYGTQWYPYLMRRLAERPANIAFMIGNVLKESLRWR